MKPGIFAFIIFLVIIGWTFSAFMEMDYVTVHASELDPAVTYSVMQINDISTWTVVNFFPRLFFEILPKVLTWNFAFLEGGFEWVRWFFLWPISAFFMFAVGIVFWQIVRGWVTRTA